MVLNIFQRAILGQLLKQRSNLVFRSVHRNLHYSQTAIARSAQNLGHSRSIWADSAAWPEGVHSSQGRTFHGAIVSETSVQDTWDLFADCFSACDLGPTASSLMMERRFAMEIGGAGGYSGVFVGVWTGNG